MFNFFSRKLKIKEPYAVLGDSHVRAFSHNKNFFPVFLGPGKENCFVSDEHAANVEKRIFHFLDSVKVQNLILVLGEPDTRYFLKDTWTPWDEPTRPDRSLGDYEDQLRESFRRYSSLIAKLSISHRLFVLNITPSLRQEQNAGVRFLNKLLAEYCTVTKVKFLDINQEISEASGLADKKFLLDHVHCGIAVQPVIEKKLQQLGEVIVPGEAGIEHGEEESIKNNFEFNKKFGCFVLKSK